MPICFKYNVRDKAVTPRNGKLISQPCLTLWLRRFLSLCVTARCNPMSCRVNCSSPKHWQRYECQSSPNNLKKMLPRYMLLNLSFYSTKNRPRCQRANFLFSIALNFVNSKSYKIGIIWSKYSNNPLCVTVYKFLNGELRHLYLCLLLRRRRKLYQHLWN